MLNRGHTATTPQKKFLLTLSIIINEHRQRPGLAPPARLPDPRARVNPLLLLLAQPRIRSETPQPLLLLLLLLIPNMIRVDPRPVTIPILLLLIRPSRPLRGQPVQLAVPTRQRTVRRPSASTDSPPLLVMLQVQVAPVRATAKVRRVTTAVLEAAVVDRVTT